MPLPEFPTLNSFINAPDNSETPYCYAHVCFEIKQALDHITNLHIALVRIRDTAAAIPDVRFYGLAQNALESLKNQPLPPVDISQETLDALGLTYDPPPYPPFQSP